MFSEGIFELIKEVLTSWQVIVVTIGIILYLNIVFYVARHYHAPRIKSIAKKISSKSKKEPEAPAAAPEEDSSDDSDEGNDDLGLEEE